MATKPLLCELHAHTTWSDGGLSVRALVDLYGRAGFDVLAITDHVVRSDQADFEQNDATLRSERFSVYLEEIEAHAERALLRYRMLVIPGLELTYDDPDPRRAAHTLALGLRSFIGLGGDLDAALGAAAAAGAVLIAAHPYTLAAAGAAARTTARFAEEPEWAAASVHRFEVCNRHDFFDWVAQARLPVVASGDFHRPEHLETWKTLVSAEPSEEAVLEHLRTGRPVSLTRLDAASRELIRAA
ncbi:MAG TPA: PHP domain-containing protein [Gaiellaceae bacterium]